MILFFISCFCFLLVGIGFIMYKIQILNSKMILIESFIDDYQRKVRIKKIIPKVWIKELVKILDNDSLDTFMNWWEEKTDKEKSAFKNEELWHVLYRIWTLYNEDKWKEIVKSAK